MVDLSFSDFFAVAVPAAVVVGSILGAAAYFADRAGVAPWLVWLTALPTRSVSDPASTSSSIRLKVAGMEAFSGSLSQLRAALVAAGLEPWRARDVGIYRPSQDTRLAEYPPEIIDLVRSCYDCGTCRGVELAMLISDARTVDVGSCLWFFLEQIDADPVVTAFVAPLVRDQE